MLCYIFQNMCISLIHLINSYSFMYYQQNAMTKIFLGFIKSDSFRPGIGCDVELLGFSNGRLVSSKDVPAVVKHDSTSCIPSFFQQRSHLKELREYPLSNYINRLLYTFSRASGVHPWINCHVCFQN